MITADFEDQTIATYDKYASDWAQEHSDRTELTALLNTFKQLLPQGSVLEIGAGGGSDAKGLAEAGYKYFGTDASMGMVEASRTNQPNLHFEQMSVYDLAQLKKQFDGFWASAVLLHIPRARVDEALQAINAVTAEQGIGYISMKDGTEEVFEERKKRDRQEKRIFTYWTKDDFTEALQRNGFEVVDYRYNPRSERTRWHLFFVKKIS